MHSDSVGRLSYVCIHVHRALDRESHVCYGWAMKNETRTPNVRVSAHTHALLRQLAEDEDDSMQAVLDKAIERYRRDRFLRDANADFAALKRDTRAWKEDLNETNLWEHTLADGLTKE